MAATMTQDQFKEALKDYLILSDALAQLFPDEVSENLATHIEHCLKNPCALKLMFDSLEARGQANGAAVRGQQRPGEPVVPTSGPMIPGGNYHRDVG